jgi:voltage-gated potassium channel Kch
MRKIVQNINNTWTIVKSRHPIFTAVLMILFCAMLLVLILSGVLTLIDKNIKYSEALKTIFTYHTGTASANNPNNAIFTVRLFAIISGTLLFSGTIISIMTTLIRNYITNRDGAKGRLRLSNHLLILCYNKEVPAILADLMFNPDHKTILLLSDAKKQQVFDELNATIAELDEKPKYKINLIVRQGNPASLSELKDVGIERASAILIMNINASVNNELCETDYLGSLDLVLKLGSFNLRPNVPIGVETSTQEASDIMRSLHKDILGLNDKQIQFFAHHKKIGQFMALAVSNPDLCNVLLEFLSYRGCEFYPIDKISREEYLENHCEGIPTVVFADKMYCLADDEAAARRKRAFTYKTERRLQTSKAGLTRHPLKLFVIGKNRKYKYLVEALKLTHPDTVINHFETNDIHNYVDTVMKQGDRNSVAVVLSDDTVSPKSYDANVFWTVIELSRVATIKERPFKIFAEIIDPKNQKSLENLNIQNFVVSTQVISTFSNKLLNDANSVCFYEELFMPSSSFGIDVSYANEIFDITEAQTFSSYAEFVHAGYYGTRGADRTIIPFGIYTDSKNYILFCAELDKKREFVVNPADKIIYACIKTG